MWRNYEFVWKYDGKYGRYFVSWFFRTFLERTFFFFFRIRTPFSLELGPKKSMKKGSKRKTLGIWYVQASQMDPIQRNSMEVGVLVESFAVFWRLFMAFELPIVAVGPILKSKVFKCMLALRISLCVKPCKKAPRTVSTKGTSDIVSWRVDYSTLL